MHRRRATAVFPQLAALIENFDAKRPSSRARDSSGRQMAQRVRAWMHDYGACFDKLT